MANIDDGGKAFPRSGAFLQEGMSLRDYYAGQIIAGRMINGFASSADAATHARVAYKIADAMIAARKADNG